MFKNTQPIVGKKHIVFSPEFVGLPQWTLYAKIPAGGKAPQ